MKFLISNVCLESIELVFNLIVDVLVFTLSFYGLDSTVFLHYNVVRIEQPLLLNTINRDDREILLTSITIYIYPFNTRSAFAMLLKHQFTSTTDNARCETRCVLMIGVCWYSTSP